MVISDLNHFWTKRILFRMSLMFNRIILGDFWLVLVDWTIRLLILIDWEVLNSTDWRSDSKRSMSWTTLIIRIILIVSFNNKVLLLLCKSFLDTLSWMDKNSLWFLGIKGNCWICLIHDRFFWHHFYIIIIVKFWEIKFII